MNICPLFLVVDFPTVHRILVTFTVRDPLHYGPYTVHVRVQQYTTILQQTLKNIYQPYTQKSKTHAQPTDIQTSHVVLN